MALDAILREPTSESTFVARSRVYLLHSHEYSSNHDWEMYFVHLGTRAKPKLKVWPKAEH